MDVSNKCCVTALLMFPCFAFAIQTGPYAEVGIGASNGPSYVVAPATGFVNSGGTLTAGVTDVYGLNTRGQVGAYADLGYSFTSYLGIEANYTYWGQQSLSTFTGQITTATGGMKGHLEAQSVGGNLVGYLPLNNYQLNIFAKVGVAALFSSLSVNDPQGAIFFNPGSYNQDNSSAALTYGTGVQYQYNPNISISLAWNGISQFDSTPISNQHYNMGSIGVRYTFPNAAPKGYEK